MLDHNIKEYELVRQELASIKNCITTYVSYLIGGTGVGFFSITLFETETIPHSISLFFVMGTLFIVTAIYYILIYKFISHNRYSGYLRLINQETDLEPIDKEATRPLVKNLVAWELSMSKLQNTIVGVKDFPLKYWTTKIQFYFMYKDKRIQFVENTDAGKKAFNNFPELKEAYELARKDDKNALARKDDKNAFEESPAYRAILKDKDHEGFKKAYEDSKEIERILLTKWEELKVDDPELDKRALWNGLGLFIKGVNKKDGSKSWKYPLYTSYIVVIFIVILQLVGFYFFITFLASIDPKDVDYAMVYNLSFSTYVLAEAMLLFIWSRNIRELFKIMNGSKTINSFCWKFLQYRIEVANQYGYRPIYHITERVASKSEQEIRAKRNSVLGQIR